MKKQLRIIAIAAVLLGIFPGEAQTVRDLKYEITDTAIVFPESQQADVHRMMQNWYLQNYTVLDTIGRPDVPASDEVLTKRLSSLPTTIEMPFNPVVRNYIDLYTRRRRSLVETMLGLSLYYMPIFEEALEREGLPLELRNLPIIESAMNPNAVSRAGATGLWQFMLPTARGLGLEVSTLVDERRDPIAASEAAARYLKQLYGIFNDWGLAIAAYNCGPGNINKALARAGASTDNPMDYWDIYYHLPAETRGYVPGFIGATYAMAYYGDHGISPALAKRPIITDTIHVNSRTHFTAISNVLGIPVDELRVLNPQYRKDIIPGDIKPYALRLPSQLVFNYLMFADSIKSASELLAPRTSVELGGKTIAATGEGTYKNVVKYHKVRRGETLASIAADFGVTVNQLKKWNGLKTSKVRRGASLKIHTKEFVPAEPKAEEASPAIADTTIVTPIDSVAVDSIAEEVKPVEQKPKQTPKPKATTTTHKVAKGETLYAISRKYNVTVKQIKDANGLTSDNLSVGQRLKIPRK
ncbi:MAG: transglycosylase SLT domain-containing protein [Bacteroides sp.]|nr:transglycosylase SLT domain-containing protein [Bacteroides sp.]MCM1378917.1 transglycosylase SLT domain-containing protein [Bacteroides sp.]MCM1445533.1 transglycosylase SLT domain-containing protein [Prevotella sp.]